MAGLPKQPAPTLWASDSKYGRNVEFVCGGNDVVVVVVVVVEIEFEGGRD